MMKTLAHNLLALSLGTSLTLGASLLLGGLSASAQVDSVTPVTRYIVGGDVAEIISATPDGRTVVFTNSDGGAIGLVDITNPSAPEALGSVDVSELGEPTSVVVTPNGQYAVAGVLSLIDQDAGETIADQTNGYVVFIDIETQSLVASVELDGIGPDSVAITPDGTKAVIAIEDEEDEDNLPGDRPGSINIVTLDYADPANSFVSNVAIDLTDIEGVNYPTDPQPEFISINPAGTIAAVSVQENNAITLISLDDEEQITAFSAGTSVHDVADLVEDDDIKLESPFEGRREPDAIAFTPDGNYLVLANEGDTDLERFGDGIWSGGRGWTIIDLEGNVIYDSGSDLEKLAVLRGHYPEGRSENRGIEVEGVATARYFGTPVAIVGSERGSFITVYDISDPAEPEPLSFHPTGLGPEGILPIPNRNLLLTSNEEDGTIDVFTVNPTYYTSSNPVVVSESLDTPYAALSGLYPANDEGTVLYAVPDNALSPSRIFTIELQGEEAVVTDALMLTIDSEAASFDLEGIAVDPSGGFWAVSEGDNREDSLRPHLLIRINVDGSVAQTIELPEAEAEDITRFGFEGVTTDGETVYIAIQREFLSETGTGQTRIAAYSIDDADWEFYLYPLDNDNVDDSWVGLSEIALDTDGSFVVIERDNQGGENGAANIRVKRIYRFSLEGVEPGETVEKELVVDLVEEYDWQAEKVEGLAVTEDGYWIVSDNDGGETFTQMLFVER